MAHITAISICWRDLLCFETHQGGLQSLGSWGLGQKRDSPWYLPCSKPMNEPRFTGDGNSGLRVVPQGNSLSVAPYQLCLTQMGRGKPGQQQSRPNVDNRCVTDTQSLCLSLAYDWKSNGRNSIPQPAHEQKWHKFPFLSLTLLFLQRQLA